MKFHDDELGKLACSDGGCCIQRPTGMHTNGGCHCLDDIKDVHARMRVRRVLDRYRQIVDVLANAKLLPDEKGAP